MKKGSTHFLRAVIALIGLVVLALCVFVLPVGLGTDVNGYYKPIIMGLYVAAVPFFLALYQAIRLLGQIDKNSAFTLTSVQSLRKIKLYALVISGIFIGGMPSIFYAADNDDAPGVVAIGLVIMFASFVIATFAAVLQRLIQNAIDIKTENDLTV